jgi:holo-[acyl-carrier protein] synthase
MAARVGIDLISVEDIQNSLAAHGQRYLSRVFTPVEVAQCTVGADPSPRRLAGCFAAKEAVAKLLQAGRGPLGWHEIEVRRESAGQSSVGLRGNAQRLADRAGIAHVAVSISHRRESAAAVALADVKPLADVAQSADTGAA